MQFGLGHPLDQPRDGIRDRPAGRVRTADIYSSFRSVLHAAMLPGRRYRADATATWLPGRRYRDVATGPTLPRRGARAATLRA